VSCSDVCGALSGGNVDTWRCDPDAGVSTCRPAACSPGYGNCDDGGTTCEADLTNDPDNCGACDQPVDPLRGTRCVGGLPACGVGTAGCDADGGFSCLFDDAGTLCCPADNTNCAGTCINLSTDPGNCGACGEAIDTLRGNHCVAGASTCSDGGTCDPDGGSTCVAEYDGGPHASQCCGGGTVNCAGECVNLLTDSNHCGSCVNLVSGHVGADRCENGAPVCGPGGSLCQAEQPLCSPGPNIGCYECLTDLDCAAGDGVCCGGTCTPKDQACGCPATPGALFTPSACSASGVTGGACIGTSGAPLLSTDAAEDFHAGACGCVANGQLPVTDHAICEAEGLFHDLCAVASGVVGACIAQGVPARDGTVGAQNCGVVGRTCDPSLGGLNCSADAGVGVCSCNSDSPIGAQDGCKTPVFANGRTHVVADYCRANDPKLCDCENQANIGPCSAIGATPDCCPTGCVDLATNVANCGLCGSACAGGQQCTSLAYDGGPPIAACGCTAPGECRAAAGTVANSRWPTNDCIAETCVCSLFRTPDGSGTLSACPVGKYCCDGVARPTTGTDTGCCDMACGTSDDNRCLRYPGGPRQ